MMRYLQGTKYYILIYRHIDNIDVIDYSVSNFVRYIDSCKLTSWYIITIDVRTISWSVKQTLIAISTMKVEFVSCFETNSHSVSLKSFISKLRVIYSISRLLRIFYNNLATVFIAKNNKSEIQIKHIHIKHLAIRERIKKKESCHLAY